MDYPSSFGNFAIFIDNLSVYYTGMLVISFLAILLTWWFRDIPVHPKQFHEDEDNVSKGAARDSDGESILTRYKSSRQKVIAEQLAAELTEEQLQEEKEVERQQLEAIFQLLKDQEEKFRVNSMDELEEQLRLYRR